LTLSTNFNQDPSNLGDWISQAEASRIHGVSRQAISKLVRAGRLRSKSIGGRVFVSRSEVESFHPLPSGRPREEDIRDLNRLRKLIGDARPEVRLAIFDELRKEYPIHPLEAKIGISAEVILSAAARSGELTLRMTRDVIAEAAFETYVVNALPNWVSEPVLGNQPFDFRLRDAEGPLTVQVKLQRSERGVPKLRGGLFVAETQRTRSGPDQSTGLSTRPYHFGEFDILAVAMHPSSQRWDLFYYTVERWLVPRTTDANLMEVYQPVAIEPNEDWTDNFPTCVAWLRSGKQKTIHSFR